MKAYCEVAAWWGQSNWESCRPLKRALLVSIESSLLSTVLRSFVAQFALQVMQVSTVSIPPCKNTLHPVHLQDRPVVGFCDTIITVPFEGFVYSVPLDDCAEAIPRLKVVTPPIGN
jgi:hypothetical protein